MKAAKNILKLIIAAVLLVPAGKSPAQNKAAQSLPYFCNFASETEIEDNWLVDDANEDKMSWKLDWWIDDDDTYHATISTYYDITEGMPEALITGQPFALQADKDYHIAFDVETHWYSGEVFEVRYGKTTETGRMTVLQRYENVNEGEAFAPYSINFKPEEDGDYYFAFVAYHVEDSYVLNIDNVEIAEGITATTGKPDLQVNRLVWPVSSCMLTDAENVVINVSNIGRGNIKKFKVNGTVGSQTVDKILDIELGSHSPETDVTVGTYNFETLQSYDINLTVTVIAEGEEYQEDPNTTNNTLQKTVQHWTPLDLPLISDFAKDSTTFEQNWTQEGTSWGYVYTEWSGYLYPNNPDNPLISRCFNLSAGKQYRLEATYYAGWKFRQYIYYDDFKILCGPSGSNPLSYKTIYEVVDGYTGEQRETACIPFTVDEDGVYDLIIMYTRSDVASLSFYNISLTENPDYDLRAEAILTEMPVWIPLDQYNGTYDIDVKVENRGGQNVEEAKVEVFTNAGKIGEATLNDFAAGAARIVPVSVSVNNASLGPDTLRASVSIIGQEDAFPADNTVTGSDFTATYSYLAYDRWENWMWNWDGYIVGNGYGLTEFGMPFFVNNTDTLTAVSMLWGESYESYETEISVYRFDNVNTNLGDKLYGKSFEKKAAAGEQIYAIDNLVLERGWYFISADAYGYVAAVDRTLPNRLYTVVDSVLMLQTSDDMGIPFGSAVLRAVFGEYDLPVEPGNESSAEAGIAFKLYPNPAKDAFTVATEENARMEIYNVSGQRVLTSNLAPGQQSFRLKTSGLYLVKLTAGGRTSVKRLIVE